MDYKNKNNNNSNQNSKGFYIAVCCCVIVLGVTGYITNTKKNIPYDENIPGPTQEIAKITHTPVPKSEESPQPAKISENENPQIIENTPTTLPVQHAQTVISAAANPDDFDIIEAGEPAEFYEDNVMTSVTVNAAPNFIMPVIGEISEVFSGDSMIFNNAMGDWRTHNGIDIIADADSEVLAAADGTIKSIYTNYMGNVVVITHSNGYETLYACLKSTDGLEVGQEILQGDVISTLSEIPEGENTKKPHLHFELSNNDTPINPFDIIKN